MAFKNKGGGIEGLYSYDECDTAEKFLDVACVIQTAQIEPSATRLLNIQCAVAGYGIARPDSTEGFDKVFGKELKILMEAKPRKSNAEVTVTAYR